MKIISKFIKENIQRLNDLFYVSFINIFFLIFEYAIISYIKEILIIRNIYISKNKILIDFFIHLCYFYVLMVFHNCIIFFYFLNKIIELNCNILRIKI